MPLLQVCGQGHRWDPTNDRRTSVEDRWNRCPTCGAEADLVSLRETHATSSGDSAPELTQPYEKPSSSSELPTITGYEMIGQIGHGGMGVVFRAKHVASSRIVALKMVSSGAHASPNEKARFRTETESARRIRHANVVEVTEVGEQNGLPFVAMEYMDRGSLSDALGGAQMPPRYAAELVELLARGVQAAHDQGVLHRDIKPGNVMLTTPPADASLPYVVQLIGVPKITDFGLAKRMDGEGALTRTGAVMGTPSYMAPEQAEGKVKQFGPAVDVHALGAILYEALTGRPPFKGATMMETLDQVRTQEPTAPSQIVPGLPRDLSTVCIKALEKEPARRYGSAQALADDLRRYLNGQTITARPMGSIERGVRWVRKRGVAVAGAVVVLAALGVAAAAMMNRDKGQPDPTPTIAEDPNAAKVQHFANFVTRRGVPEGVAPLTDDQVRRRELSYRFTSRKGKVERVEAINRAGDLTNEHNIAPYLDDDRDRGPIAAINFRRQPQRRLLRDDCRWDYVRKDNGELTEERAYDREGRLVWGFHYLTPTTGFYTDSRDLPRPRAGSGAAYVSFEYSPEGWTTAIRYRDHSGNSRGDNSDIFGRRFAHDSRGFVIRESFLGPRDLPMLHPDGYATEERTLDAQGNVVERRFLGLDGRLARSYGVGGWAKEVMTYNADGHLLEWRSLDVDGKPLRNPNLGFGPGGGFGGGPGAGVGLIRNTYDDLGRRTRRENFDGEGKPAVGGAASVGHGTEFRYDDRGRCIEEITFDAEGKPNGSSRKMRFDDRSRLVESHVTTVNRTFQGAEIPASLRSPRGTRMTYDDQGRLVEQWYVDDKGQPEEFRGVARIVAVIGPNGRPSELMQYDLQGRPAGDVTLVSSRPPPDAYEARPPAQRVVGPARYKFGWDERGNLIDVALFGVDDKPYASDRRYGGPSATTNIAAFLRGWVGIGMVLNNSQASRTTWRFDDRGNITEMATFDADDKPVANLRNGTARVTMAYDEHGKCIETAYFGFDGKLIQPSATFTTIEGGELIPSTRSPARTTARYDADGRLVAVSYFDADNKPYGARSYPSREWAYDRFGHIRQAKTLDADGKAIDANTQEFTHDEIGRVKSISYSDRFSERAGFKRVTYAYDSEGRLTEARYSDRDGKVVQTRVAIQSPQVLNRAFGLPTSFVDIDDIGIITTVNDPNGPFESGDEVVEYDGQPVVNSRMLFARKATEEYGTNKLLTLRRRGKMIKVTVPSGPSRITEATAQRSNLARYLFGFGIGGTIVATPQLPTDSVHGLGSVAVNLPVGP